jgi:hypothetical protein
MFDPKSRYAGLETYTVTDRRGRTVTVVSVPEPPEQALLGYHVLRQGQRLDHIAQKYLDDPAGYWRIAEFNDVMHAEMLTETPKIAIPRKGR